MDGREATGQDKRTFRSERARLRPNRMDGIHPDNCRRNEGPMFQNLTISNFRGFSELQLGDFRRINLITGANGIGKTGILEALFLNAKGCSPTSLSQLNQVRGEIYTDPTNDRPFRNFFNDLKGSEPAVIKTRWLDDNLEDEGKNRNFSVRKLVSPLFSKKPANPEDFLTGLEISLEVADKVYTSDISWNEQFIRMTPNGPQISQPIIDPNVHINYGVAHGAPSNEETLGVFFYTPAPPEGMAFTYDRLVDATRNKTVSNIIDIVTLVDGRVSSLIPLSEGGSNSIYVDVGAERLIPLTMMGAGFCNIMQIACGLCMQNVPLCFMDELEDGLHHTTFPNIAKAIIEFSKNKKTQFFITTHSAELLNGFIDAAIDMKYDDICCYKINEKNKKKISTKFDEADLENAKEIKMDVR